MLAGFAKHLTQQLGAAIGDQMVLGEIRGAVDQAHDLDDARHVVEPARGCGQRAQQIDGDGARGLLPTDLLSPLRRLANPELSR